MNRTHLFLLLSSALLASQTPTARGDGFPNAAPTDIGAKLPKKFEASGGAWHPRLDRLFTVSDNGKIAELNSTGSELRSWSIKGNWEGVAVADPKSDFIYLVDEKLGVIREFDFAKGALTSRAFNLTTATPSPGVPALTTEDLDALVDGEDQDNRGVEALAFVPDAADPEGGYFVAGSQENGTIYKFRLSLHAESQVVYLGKFKSWTYTDLSGLEWDWTRKVLLAVWDKDHRIRTMNADGTMISEWKTPAGTKDVEGLAVNGNSLFIMQDGDDLAKSVRRYDNVPF